MRTENKKYAQRAHAKSRAMARFGIDLTKDLRQIIVGAIQRRDGLRVLLDRQSLRVSRYLMRLQGEDVVVVYDRTRREIVTFLTPEMWINGIDDEIGVE